MKRVLTEAENKDLLKILRKRFEKNMHRHKSVSWEEVNSLLSNKPETMWSLGEMERTGGEPDVIGIDSGTIIFCDCCPETPIGRRWILSRNAPPIKKDDH